MFSGASSEPTGAQEPKKGLANQASGALGDSLARFLIISRLSQAALDTPRGSKMQPPSYFFQTFSNVVVHITLCIDFFRFFIDF